MHVRRVGSRLSLRSAGMTIWLRRDGSKGFAALLHLPEEMSAQHLAASEAGRKTPGVDDGEAETAGRHRMARGLAVLKEGDLHAGDVRHRSHLLHQCRRRMAV